MLFLRDTPHAKIIELRICRISEKILYQHIIHIKNFIVMLLGTLQKLDLPIFSGLVTTDDSIRKINPIEYQKKKQNH